MATATPSTAIDARMVRTRAALRTALLTLIERQSFDALSIRDLVAEAGIGYATFFRHYPSKVALLEEVTEDELRGLVQMTMPDQNAPDIRASTLALCHHVDTHRAFFTALLTGGAAGIMRETLARVSTETAPTVGQRKSWLPTELGVIFGVSATVEILAWWLRQDDAVPVEQVAEILDRLVVTPTIGGE